MHVELNAVTSEVVWDRRS